jgi:hypothetical protein
MRPEPGAGIPRLQPREEVNNAWHVPGGPTIADGTRERFVPPLDWRREIFDVWRVPPSMNTNEIRSHWRGFQKHKKDWESEIRTLLMMRRIPPHSYQRAIAGAIIRFPKRAARRDSGNFAGVVEKALGDALQTMRVIPDDDDKHYHFAGVEFAEEIGAPRTWIHLFLCPPD